MKEPDPCFDLAPGSQYGHDAQQEREHDHEKAQAIDCQVEPDSQLRNPGPVGLYKPMSGASQALLACMLEPDLQREHKSQDVGTERNPASCKLTPASGSPGQQSGDERNQDEPDENH